MVLRDDFLLRLLKITVIMSRNEFDFLLRLLNITVIMSWSAMNEFGRIN